MSIIPERSCGKGGFNNLKSAALIESLCCAETQDKVLSNVPQYDIMKRLVPTMDVQLRLFPVLELLSSDLASRYHLL